MNLGIVCEARDKPVFSRVVLFVFNFFVPRSYFCLCSNLNVDESPCLKELALLKKL